LYQAFEENLTPLTPSPYEVFRNIEGEGEFTIKGAAPLFYPGEKGCPGERGEYRKSNVSEQYREKKVAENLPMMYVCTDRTSCCHE
jgi:hypothetical protein